MILNWILSLASAALLVLLFPKFSFTWAAPLALTPLLLACAREPRWRWRFLLGYAAGIVYWFGLCNWIQATLAHYAGVSAATAWLLFALFCLAKALQMGAFAAVAGNFLKKSWAPPAVAALWVVLEWTHAWTGFEWLNLGNAASDMEVPLRLAPMTGVWGLSFVFALMSAVIACVILRRHRFASAWLLLLVGLLALPSPPPLERTGRWASVIQPNMDDDTEWSRELLLKQAERMKSLSVDGATDYRDTTDIVVWPEVPAPFYQEDPNFRALLASAARESHAGVLAGVVAHAPDGRPLNSALLIDSNGSEVSRYDKVHLVPFGEFVPWPFGLLTSKVSAEAGDFEAGNGIVVSKLGTHKIATFICYESVFPSYVRRFAAGGAEVLFNISNDSWFGKSAARYQHLQIVRMRAAENRRWIIRSTNNGISGAIDPTGRVVVKLPESQEVASLLTYNYRTDLTVYTRFGDWFILLCVIIVLATLMSDVLPARRRL